MNHIYRSIWSESLATWIAVPENTASKGKRSAVKKAVIATGLAAFSSAGFALPTGGQVVAGQVSVSTPSATQMNIQQGSQNAVVNWNGFSIAAPETVNIQQPNVSAVLLNRVVGMDASLIQGHLNANGQVYLVNPNGVLFSNTAQVDVGGLVASTNNISNADFLAGKNHFTADGSTASVVNQGRISVPTGGTVALIGTQVENTGTIATPQGSTILAAGKTVDLDFKGNGLVEVKIPEAALNAQVANSGAILADAGRVVLTANAANQLAGTVINQTGLIQAHSLTSRKGEILLDGGANGTVQAGGTLDASGQNANGGTVNVFAGMQNGTVNVAGKLDASAPTVGNGGFIETSAAHVKVADSAKVSTLAANGLNGTWLIDPVDFTVATSGADMTGAAVGAALAGGNFTIASTSGAKAGNGDVNINDVVTWSANKLTLNAQRNININANMNATGSAALALEFGQGAVASNNTSTILTSSGAAVNLPASTTNFTTKQGSNGGVKNYTVITSLGAAGSTTTTDLQGMNGGLANNYALGANIDATSTSSWNTNAGFAPVGAFTGTFDGLGHAITGLTINRPTTAEVGLFGYLSTATVRNVGLVDNRIVGGSNVGALMGYGDYSSRIDNAYATGHVTGTNRVGGLAGLMWGTAGGINHSYATGVVTGTSDVGGLVGGIVAGSIITNDYAVVNVTGTNNVGGLVGFSGYGSTTISKTYAAGSVNNGVAGATVGGLVGANNSSSNSSISSSYWDIEATGQSKGVGTGFTPTGVTGKTTAQMMQASTFVGWDFGSIWDIKAGVSRPFFHKFTLTQQATVPNEIPDLDDQISALQNSGTKNRFLKEHDHSGHEHGDDDENQKVDVDGQGQLLPTGVKGMKPVRHENDKRLDMRFLRWLSFLGIHI